MKFLESIVPPVELFAGTRCSQDSSAAWGLANGISWEQQTANPSSSTEDAHCLRHTTFYFQILLFCNIYVLHESVLVFFWWEEFISRGKTNQVSHSSTLRQKISSSPGIYILSIP